MSSLFKANTTHDPIKKLLNAETMEERDTLTTEWRDRKLQELNFIGVVVSLDMIVSEHSCPWLDTDVDRARFSLACFREPARGRLS